MRALGGADWHPGAALARGTSVLHPAYALERRACIVCAPYLRSRYQRNLARLRLFAASLHRSGGFGRESGLDKQETPDPARSEVSTAPVLMQADRRAAGVHRDTRSRQ